MKCKILLFLVILSIFQVFGEEYKNSLFIKETAYPLIPAMSELHYERYSDKPFGIKALPDSTFSLWYMASTAYFLPDPFVEIGLTCQTEVLERNSFSLDLGVGTAYSSEGEECVSIPFIGVVQGEWLFPGGEWSVEGINRFFVYGEGFIYKLDVPFSYGFFEDKLVLKGGPGFNLGYSWEVDYMVWAYKVFLAVQYNWGEK